MRAAVHATYYKGNMVRFSVKDIKLDRTFAGQITKLFLKDARRYFGLQRLFNKVVDRALRVRPYELIN